MLKDFGVVSPTESTEVIDRYKLRREWRHVRDGSLQVQPCDQIKTLHFDGRKDKTLKLEKRKPLISKSERKAYNSPV